MRKNVQKPERIGAAPDIVVVRYQDVCYLIQRRTVPEFVVVDPLVVLRVA